MAKNTGNTTRGNCGYGWWVYVSPFADDLGHTPKQLRWKNRRVGIWHGIALREKRWVFQLVANPQNAVDNESLVAGIQNNVAGNDLSEVSLFDHERVTGPYHGKHAVTRDSKTH